MIKVVGILNGEVYGVEDEKVGCDGIFCFCVIRPVSKEQFEDYKDIHFWMDNEREYWVDAVRCEKTDLGLEDYFKELLKEHEGNEDFLLKDDSFTDMLDEDSDLYGEVVDYIQKDLDIEVATFECSGLYPPKEYGKYKRFDKVLNWDLAIKYYKQVNI